MTGSIKQKPSPFEAQRHRVLVVEDEILIRLDIAETLRAAGYHVLEAGNADEARALLDRGGPVDALVTDIQMPGTHDGLALAEWVRSNWPRTKIVVISGNTTVPRMTGQIDIFFRKPYDRSTLVERMRSLLVKLQ